MSVRRLEAWAGAVRVGALGYDDATGLFAFDYDPAWRASEDAFPLSPALPLQEAPQDTAALVSARVRRFFENLLPEGQALDDVVAVHHVSKGNLFGLLHVLGRETTGALSLLPEGGRPDDVPDVRREIPDAELSERLRSRPEVPFSVWDGRVRLSVAGLQDKLAVYRDAGRHFLVEGRLASTHLLKPEPSRPGVPHLVANEHFCLGLAGRLGVDACEASILRVPEPVLAVARFDRQPRGDRVDRSHVIDACQALDLGVGYKYERPYGSGRDVAHVRDGASLERLFGLADHAVTPAAMRLGLLRWALLQYLVGNSDAHGKNLSLHVVPGGLHLAPAYDVVSVVAYPGFDHELAMAIGDEFDLDAVRTFDWAEMAERCVLDRRLVAREMRRMTRVLPGALETGLAWDGYAEEERPLLEVIATQALRQGEQLTAVARDLSPARPRRGPAPG